MLLLLNVKVGALLRSMGREVALADRALVAIPAAQLINLGAPERPLLVIVETFYHCCPSVMGNVLEFPSLARWALFSITS
jgi:hypothetical protein